MLRLLGTGAFFAGCAAAREEDRLPLAEATLSKAGVYSAKHGGTALLIKQRGKVLHESYANGGGKKEPHKIYSGTKAFWCIAALAAVEDKILSLDEPASETLPEWRESRGKKKITVKQLLLFTAGLERGLKIHNDGLEDRNAIAMSRPLVAAPGDAFIYGPSQLQVVHEILKRKLAKRWRGETPTRYLERRVLRPLGLGAQRYIPDAKGNPLLAAGFVMTAQQWSRMGDLILRKGSPVLDADTFDRVLEGSEANRAYGYGIWNNRAAGNRRAREVDVEDMLEKDWDQQSWSRACLCRQAPDDLLACIGSGYNRLFVIPSQDLVIVRQGWNGGYGDAEFLRLLFGEE
jgi:CubicO group peptidase (beta-lactamase class C family)